jgi:hypothetical protein
MALPPQQAAIPAPTAAPAQSGGDAAALYRALRDQRDVLGEQRQTIEGQREDLQQQLQRLSSGDPGRDGITRRIQAMDARIQDLDGQIAKSDAAVATQAAIPGATVQPPEPPRDENVDMDMVVGLSFVVVMVFAIPIAIAFARRIWRRSARTEVTLPPQLNDRMESLERGMEAIALEVERIGEGQRFVTQALTERLEVRSIGAGAAQPIAVNQGERAEHRR